MRCALRETYVRYSKANVLYSVVAPEGLPTYDRIYEGELLWCVEVDVFLSSRGLLRRVYGHVVLRWEK